MNWIAAFFTLVMLAAFGLTGTQLRAVLIDQPPQLSTEAVAFAEINVEREEDSAQGEVILWPALFGEPMPPKPPAPPPQPIVAVVEPQPPAPPQPPLSSLGYQLKGVVRIGDVFWGLVSHPAGDQILRAGSVLVDGITVARIDDEGLWVETGRAAPELLGFAEEN